jgi:Putative Actinobacterial Holin-X, holin superfamily III
VPDTEPKSLPEVATEVWTLTKDYARQETIEPLKGVGRYLGFGVAGALLGGLGVVLLMLSALRALQNPDITGTTFDGNWSWAPYLIVLVVALLIVAWAVTRISKK